MFQIGVDLEDFPFVDGDISPALVAEMSDAARLEELRFIEFQRARLDARQARVLAAVARDSGDTRFVECEVGAALRWAPHYAGGKVATATELVDRLPETIAALDRGEIDLAKAAAVADTTVVLAGDQARALETRVLPHAADRTLVQVRRSVRYHLARVDPDGCDRRREQRRQERRVEYRPCEDGMAELFVYDTADRVLAIHGLLDHAARTAKAAGATGPVNTLRTDALADLVLGAGRERVTVELQITLPATTILGTGDEPGELAGYGPVTPDTVAQITAEYGTVWRRILTDTVTDTVIDIGRRFPGERLARQIRMRDQTCRFPSCHRHARHCEIDHNQPYQHRRCREGAHRDAECPYGHPHDILLVAQDRPHLPPPRCRNLPRLGR